MHKEFPGACAPFMAVRTNGFHMMLPFDLKISRRPDDPLEAGIRIFYAKMGYSYPLRYEMGKLCSYHDGQVYDIALDDPHLLFVSVSRHQGYRVSRRVRSCFRGRASGICLPARHARTYRQSRAVHSGQLQF